MSTEFTARRCTHNGREFFVVTTGSKEYTARQDATGRWSITTTIKLINPHTVYSARPEYRYANRSVDAFGKLGKKIIAAIEAHRASVSS